MVSYDGNSNSPNTLAFVWMDRKRRYFISSCSSLQKGKPWIRDRWHQVNREDPNAEAEKVELIVPQTKCTEYTTILVQASTNTTAQDNKH